MGNPLGFEFDFLSHDIVFSQAIINILWNQHCLSWKLSSSSSKVFVSPSHVINGVAGESLSRMHVCIKVHLTCTHILIRLSISWRLQFSYVYVYRWLRFISLRLDLSIFYMCIPFLIWYRVSHMNLCSDFIWEP